MTGRRAEKGNKRSRGNNGAPRMKGFKKYYCNVGCLCGRCFRNSLKWPIYIINSVDKTVLSCNTPHRLSIIVTKLPSLNILGLGCLFSAALLIKTLLSVIFEKGVKLKTATTYFLNQTRYYASLIRCSVRQVYERFGEMA